MVWKFLMIYFFVRETPYPKHLKFVGGMHVSVWLHGLVVPVPLPSHLDGWVSFT